MRWPRSDGPASAAGTARNRAGIRPSGAALRCPGDGGRSPRRQPLGWRTGEGPRERQPGQQLADTRLTHAAAGRQAHDPLTHENVYGTLPSPAKAVPPHGTQGRPRPQASAVRANARKRSAACHHPQGWGFGEIPQGPVGAAPPAVARAVHPSPDAGSPLHRSACVPGACAPCRHRHGLAAVLTQPIVDDVRGITRMWRPGSHGRRSPATGRPSRRHPGRVPCPCVLWAPVTKALIGQNREVRRSPTACSSGA